jgi:hypothetical protein
MDWDREALEIVEAIPLPPMIAHFAKMDAERRAGNKYCIQLCDGIR